MRRCYCIATIYTVLFLLGSPAEAQRFIGCADGLTLADTATGLLWERKTTTGDVHDVSNTYTWSTTGSNADGTAHTVFRAALNAGAGFAGFTGWRLPKVSELQSILVGPGVLSSHQANVDPADPAMGTNPTGQPTTCASAPCLDPGFAAIDATTPGSPNFDYWTEASRIDNPSGAWVVSIDNGLVGTLSKTFSKPVRAVRTGTCAVAQVPSSSTPGLVVLLISMSMIACYSFVVRRGCG